MIIWMTVTIMSHAPYKFIESKESHRCLAGVKTSLGESNETFCVFVCFL